MRSKQPLASMIRPAITYSYAIAGRSFCVQPNDEWAATLIQHFLSEFHFDPHDNSLAPDYTIRISSESPAPAIPNGLDTFDVAGGHCATDGQRYYLAVEGSLIIVEPDAALGVWVGNITRARKPMALINLMAYVLEICLRRVGLYQLHGAGLVPPSGKSGVLILGSSGSGKSTVTALLASQGWSYMTDDALLLSDEGDVIKTRGIRRFFAASEAALASCSLLHLSEALGRTMLSDPNKRRLEPSVAFPGRFIPSCVPAVVVFASINDSQESQALPLSQADTMSRLIRSNPWASYDRITAKDHLRILSKLSTQCRAFSLLGGRDILRGPSVVEALLLPLV